MARTVRIPYVAQVIDYWLDSALAEAFDENELCEPMWTRLLSAAKKSKMDGYVPRGAVVALNLRHWKKTLPVLVRYGVVLEENDGWRIRSWLDHNDSQEEIADQLERKRKNLSEWRERNAGKPVTNDSGNRFVTGYQPVTNRDETADVPGTNTGRHLTPDTRHLTSYTDPPTTPTELGENGGGGFLPETRAAIARLAQRELEASPVPVGNTLAWLKAVCQRITDERGADLDAAARRLQGAERPADASSVVEEAERHSSVCKRWAGAASWGASRAPLAFIEVRDLARAQWPDAPELVAHALEAWEDTQRADTEVEVA